MSFLPKQCEDYLREKKIKFRECENGSTGQKAIILENFTLPNEKFDALSVDILILLRDGYPDIPLDMFYVTPWLRLTSNNQYPNAANQSLDFDGRNWQRWSRHFKEEDWKPGVYGIWNMLKLIEHALRTA